MRNTRRYHGIMRSIFALRIPITMMVLALFVACIVAPCADSSVHNPTASNHYLSQQQNHFVDLNTETRTPSRERPVSHLIVGLEPIHAFAIAIPIHFGVQSFESIFVLSSLLIRTLYTASQL